MRGNDDMLISDALAQLYNDIPVPDLMPGIRERIDANRKRRKPVRTAIVAVIAAALLITGCAAALGGFDWLRGVLDNDGFTDVVSPVERSVSDQDIEFSVIAAQRYGDTVFMYYSLRDTSGQNRLGEHAYPGIRTEGAHSGSNNVVYFDAESNTAVFTLTFQLDPEKSDGALKLEMSQLDCNLGERNNMEPTATSISLSGFEEGVSVSDEPGSAMPVELGRSVPEIPGARQGVVGMLDGRPFVQMAIALSGDCMNFWSPTVYVLDDSGRRYDAEVRATFVDENLEYTINAASYFVYTAIFDAPAEDIEGGTLYFGGAYSNEIYGEWEIEVEPENEPLQLDYTIDVPVDGGIIEDVKVSLTPVSLSVDGIAPTAESAEAALGGRPVTEEGIYNDEYISYSGAHESEGGFEFYFRLYYNSTVMPEDVTGIKIGDNIIPLQ